MRVERIRLRDGVGLRVARWGGARDTAEGADSPSSPPVILVHGFTGSAEAWGDVPARLSDRLSGARPVVAVDLPGHGGSDVPDTPARYAFEALVRDLAEVVDGLGGGRADLVGYSMGARVALGAAVLHPGRVGRLVLESGSPGLRTDDEREARRLRDAELAERILSRGMEAFVDEWMELPLFATQRRLPPVVLSRERSRRLRGAPRGLANALLGAGTGSQPSLWGRLGEVSSPALLVTGGEDGKFTALAAEMALGMPDARAVTVPGAGHAVHLEAPDAWLEAVATFLAGTARA